MATRDAGSSRGSTPAEKCHDQTQERRFDRAAETVERTAVDGRGGPPELDGRTATAGSNRIVTVPHAFACSRSPWEDGGAA